MPKPSKEELNPPAYTPTKQEHRIAYLSHVLDNISYDYLFSLYLDKQKIENGEGGMVGGKFRDLKELKELSDNSLRIFLSRYFKKWQDEGENREVWEIFIDYEEFKKTWGREYLARPHDGDCVCAPCSCIRCHAEEAYSIPSTVTWDKSIFYVK